MSEQTQRELAQLSVSQLQRLNGWCNDFERDWRAGETPRIEDYWNRCPESDRDALLRLIVPLDIAYRRQAGQSPHASDYTPRFALDADWLQRVLSEQTLHTRSTSAPDATFRSPLLSAGTRIGNYEIVAHVGSGGMADVYRARHLLLHRDVALKLLKETGDEAGGLFGRFQKEMVIIARLSHPHIVAAFDAGLHENRAYLVTEFIAGHDLSQVVKQTGPLPVGRAVDTIRQAAIGLDYVHRQGIVHRDVKPSNLLLDGDGRVKVSDLGLARFSPLQSGDGSLAAEQTATELVMGTVNYMAPEQAQSAKSADARSDVYSLGCTLFFLLTGRPVFPGESLINRIDAHRSEAPPDLLELRPDVPVAINTVFRRMLAKAPEERFQSMGEVAAALDSSGDDRTQHIAGISENPWDVVRDTAVRRPARNATRRNRRLGIVAAACAVALIAVAIGIVAFRNPSRSDDDPPARASREEPSPANVPFDDAAERQRRWAEFLHVPAFDTNPQGLRFALIPPGAFRQGVTPAQRTQIDELGGPAGFLELVRAQDSAVRSPFYLATTEVTNGQFRAFVSATRHVTTAEQAGTGWGLRDGQWVQGPAYSWRNLGEYQPLRDDYAVVNLSWYDAVAYCNWLTRESNGKSTYRLPTEAEWEFAARAGSPALWHFGDAAADLPEHAWIAANANNGVQRVGRKQPNPFGLHDVYGNESEWCLDRYARGPHNEIVRLADGQAVLAGYRDLRPQRGGNVLEGPRGAHSAARRLSEPQTVARGGFRVLREVRPDRR